MTARKSTPKTAEERISELEATLAEVVAAVDEMLGTRRGRSRSDAAARLRFHIRRNIGLPAAGWTLEEDHEDAVRASAAAQARAAALDAALDRITGSTARTQELLDSMR